MGYRAQRFRAATIKVDSGQETTAADIGIPLSRLHEISGTVLAKGGHAINSARIELLDPDTREQVATAYPHDEGTFHLRNIPEGTYLLAVTNAEDVGPVEVHSTPNHANDTIGRRTLRTYGTLEQPPHRPDRRPIPHPHPPQQTHPAK